MKKKLSINKSTEYDIDYSILKTLRSVPPISHLNNQELNVTASLIGLYRKYKNLNEKEQALLALSYENKMYVCSTLNLKPHQLDNILTVLRKKKILNGKNINPSLIYDISKSNYIIFQINKV